MIKEGNEYQNLPSRTNNKLEVKIEIVTKINELCEINHLKDYLLLEECVDVNDPQIQELLKRTYLLENEIICLENKLIELNRYKSDNKEDLIF